MTIIAGETPQRTGAMGWRRWRRQRRRKRWRMTTMDEEGGGIINVVATATISAKLSLACATWCRPAPSRWPGQWWWCRATLPRCPQAEAQAPVSLSGPSGPSGLSLICLFGVAEQTGKQAQRRSRRSRGSRGSRESREGAGRGCWRAVGPVRAVKSRPAGAVTATSPTSRGP